MLKVHWIKIILSCYNLSTFVIFYKYVYSSKLCKKLFLPQITLFGCSYKALLDSHLLYMARHCSGLYSGAVWPPPWKYISTNNGIKNYQICYTHLILIAHFVIVFKLIIIILPTKKTCLHSCKCHSIGVSPGVSVCRKRKIKHIN